VNGQYLCTWVWDILPDLRIIIHLQIDLGAVLPLQLADHKRPRERIKLYIPRLRSQFV